MNLRLALMVALFSAAPAVGGPIYKSVSADGRVAYGDAPLVGATHVEAISIAPPTASASTGDSTARVEQWAATTERLQKDRKEREAARERIADKRRANALANDPYPALNAVEYYEDYYPAPYLLQRPRHYPARHYPLIGLESGHGIDLSYQLGHHARSHHYWGSNDWRRTGLMPVHRSEVPLPATFRIPTKR